MTNKEAKREVFLKACKEYDEKQAKHYGYNEWVGNHQDDLNEMLDAEWIFTKAHQKVFDDYFGYFNHGINPYKTKLSKKELEIRMEKKMDTMVQVEFERFFKATY